MTTTPIEKVIRDFNKLRYRFETQVGASAVLLFDDGVIFSLVKPSYWRTDKNGLTTIDYSGIGGGVEQNETQYQCALREIHEEIGVSEKQLLMPTTIGNTLYIHNEKKRLITLKTAADEPHPICVFNMVVPRQFDRPGQKKQSCLLLFVYLMKLKGNTMPHVRKGEKISGLVHVKGFFLDDFLKGIMIKSASDFVSKGYSLHLRAQYKKQLPKQFMLSPKFTPRAIFNSGLKYKHFISHFSA